MDFLLKILWGGCNKIFLNNKLNSSFHDEISKIWINYPGSNYTFQQ